jgi:hypothetical protein
MVSARKLLHWPWCTWHLLCTIWAKKTIKEMVAVANVASEKEVRVYIKRIQKVVPEALLATNNKTATATTTVDDFIRVIVIDIEGPVLLERFAVEIAARVLNRVCNNSCIAKFEEGKRTSTLAAGAVLAAPKHGGIPGVKSEDVAACAQVGKATAVAMMKCIEGHWCGMFADRSSEEVLNEMRETDRRVKDAVVPMILSGGASPLVRI